MVKLTYSVIFHIHKKELASLTIQNIHKEKKLIIYIPQLTEVTFFIAI